MFKALKEIFNIAAKNVEETFETTTELHIEEPTLTKTQIDAMNVAYLRSDNSLSNVFKNRTTNNFNELVVSHYTSILRG